MTAQIIDCEQKRKRLDRSVAWAKENPERVRQINAKYHAANREKKLAIYNAWAKANPEKRKASNDASRKRNAEKHKARTTAWAKANPRKAAAIAHNKRARKRGAEGKHTAADTANIRKAQRDRCAYCRTPLKGRGQLDHIVALARGGSNWPANLQWLCAACNVRKGAADPIKFAKSIGRLL